MTLADLLTPGPTRVMGIVNVTPDSFADNVHRTITEAISHGIDLAEQGANLIDVGGQSTRPGAQLLPADIEAARVLPVVEALAGAGLTVSIDTFHAAVAEAAVRAGAVIINDVTGGLADPDIVRVAAATGAGYVLQHWHAPFDHTPLTHLPTETPETPVLLSHFDIGMSEVDQVLPVTPSSRPNRFSDESNLSSLVRSELAERADRAIAAGLDPHQLILDPGIGFGKSDQQNWELLANVEAIASLGFPMLWGVSRKRFLAGAYPHTTEPWQRDDATTAVTMLLAQARVWAVRTHTVAAHQVAIAVAESVRPHKTTPVNSHTEPPANEVSAGRVWGGSPPNAICNKVETDTPAPNHQPMSPTPDNLDQLDHLQVVGIEAWAHHGVFDHERRDGQPFLVDIEWWADFGTAATADQLDLVIDYGEVSSYALSFVQGEPVNLIETLAVRLQQALLGRFPMMFARVSIHKPQAPLAVGFTDVVVTTALAGGGGRDHGTRGMVPVVPSGPTPIPRQVVFSLGSNIEPRQQYLQFALAGLAATPGIEQVRVSPLYDTAAQGQPQPNFLNAVVLAQSTLPGNHLLRRALEIEQLAHRTRLSEHGPRTLDIDLISVGDEFWATADLVLPHPRASQRAFVLLPWLDLDPAAKLAGRSLSDLVGNVCAQPITRLPEALFLP